MRLKTLDKPYRRGYCSDLLNYELVPTKVLCIILYLSFNGNPLDAVETDYFICVLLLKKASQNLYRKPSQFFCHDAYLLADFLLETLP